MLIIYIVSLMYILAIILSITMIGFPIKNGLIISCTIGGPIYNKKTKPVSTEKLASKKMLADAPRSVGTEEPMRLKR